METIKKLAICTFLLMCLTPLNAQEAFIRNVNPSVSSPTCLSHRDNIEVTFSYAHRVREGVRIFVRPMSKGNLTPNYSAHGSGLYKAGKGETSGSFTITSGDILVDQIRIQVVSESGKVISNHFEEVQYLFLTNLVLNQPAANTPPGAVHVIDKTILPGGDVEILFSDKRKKRIFKGGYTIINPNGSEQMVMMMNVQPNTPPELPEDLQIVLWLEAVNENLLSSIRRMVGMDEAVVNHYLQKENEEANDLYNQIDLRMTYIDFLLSE